MPWRLLLWLAGLVALVAASAPSVAMAQEGRLALLVGNEHGWAKDPKLRYALSGDLRPLARALKRVGFEVKILANQRADQLRKTFDWLQKRLSRAPRIHTFLFYYTGHADKRYFHLGPKGKRPFGYQEFIRRFGALRVLRRIAMLDSCYSGALIRKFGSLKRYRALLAEGIAKGVRSRHRINLQQWMKPKQGHEQGLRLISSSLDLAWEMRRYRASVFTHYLLRGLKGTADLNQDGKISLDELFDFASREVTQVTGQRPQQLILLRRSTPYAIAPAYNSKLWIGPKVHGRVKVAIGNFVWHQQKRAGRALQLSVVQGEGTVYIQRKGRCWRQRVRLRKHRMARLQTRWKPTTCRARVGQSKGVIALPARATLLVPAARHSLALWGGVGLAGKDITSTMQWGGGLLWRWRFLSLGVQLSTGDAAERDFGYTRLAFETRLGWPISFRLGTQRQVLYLGAFAMLGPTFQHKEGVPPLAILSFGGGATADLSWWFTPWVGLRLGADLGADYTPAVTHDGVSLLFRTRLALLFGF